jgi:hypothetical protein
MRSQAYGTGRTVLYESLVRAVVVAYTRMVDGDDAGRKQALAEMGRGFKWTRDLSDRLAEYAADRATYPSFHDFMPRVIAFFDRPMRDRSWSVTGGGPQFPKLDGQPAYDAARRTLTLHVRLEPGKEYPFGLNGGRFFGFLSEDGYPLEPVVVTFTTRAR